MVRVLILIHQNVAEAPMILLSNQWLVFQQLHRCHDQIIEVQRIRFAHSL